MSFLFPAMLLGLAGLAIPVVLHLIARHKYQVQEFPSNRLLRPDERSNVFAMRLVDVAQLLLRLLVLLLLALAMSRLFASCAALGRAPRNLVVVVDCSASMRLRAKSPEDGTTAPLFELAREKARALLSAAGSPSQCALVAARDAVEEVAALQPAPDAALRALDGLRTTDGTGRGLVHAVARCCDMVRGRREARSQIVVLTDLRATAFEARSQQDLKLIQDVRRELGRALEIILVDVSTGREDNLAIVDASVRGQRVKVGDDAHVVARVRNMGAKAQVTSLRLGVGERREPRVREVALEPGGEVEVDLTVRVNRAVRTFVQVRLDPQDALPHDNTFGVPLNVSDARRVLIVRGATPDGEDKPSRLAGLGRTRADDAPESQERLDGATILRLVLNPGRELGRAYETGIRTSTVTPEALAAQPLSQYDIVVLHDVNALAEQALKDLETFVRQGRALLFVCSGGTNAMKFNRTFAAGGAGRSALSPVEIGNERILEPPIGIRFAESAHPVLAPFRDRLKGDLSAIRFTRVREMRARAEGATVGMSGTDGRPLAVERVLERGRIMLLAFGFELRRGNIARTRAFPALMWQLVNYLTGALREQRPDVLTASRPAVLDVSELPFAFLNELELCPVGAEGAEGNSMRLPIDAKRTTLLPGLPGGRYLLRKPQPAGEATPRTTYARRVAVNPDPRESDTRRLAEGDVASLFGERARVVSGREVVDISPRGVEISPLLVVLLVLAYAAEGVVGWALSARRERERTSGVDE